MRLELEKSTDPTAQFWAGGSRPCRCTALQCCVRHGPRIRSRLPLSRYFSAAAVPVRSALPPVFHSLCMLCVFVGTEARAAQSVSGTSAGPHDRMPHGMKAGAGRRRGPLAHRQEEAGAVLGRVPANRARSSIAFCGTSSLSLCPFPMIPSCCRRAGPKSWWRAVNAPFPRPPKVSTALWASLCLVQGLTAGEEPTLSSLCPSLERSYRWSTQPQHRNYFLGFRLSKA